MNTLIKHYESERHRLQLAIDSKTPASSEIAQMDATDLSSRRDDDNDRDTNVNGWGTSPGVSQRDPTLAGNHVGVIVTLLPRFLNFETLRSAPTCVIERQHFKTSPLCFGLCFPLYVHPFDVTRTPIHILRVSSLFKCRR